MYAEQGGGWSVGGRGDPAEREGLMEAAWGGRIPWAARVRVVGGDGAEALEALEAAGAGGAKLCQVVRAQHAASGGRPGGAPAGAWRPPDGTMLDFFLSMASDAGLDASDAETAEMMAGRGMQVPASVAAAAGHDVRAGNAEISKMESAAPPAGGGGRWRGGARLLRVRWSWLFCFGEGNSFDFEGIDGRVALLNGPNAAGKSSFLEVVCFGLHGVTTSGRAGAEDVPGRAIPAGAEPEVAVTFEAGGEVHEVRRWFAGDRRGWQARATAGGELRACGRVKVKELTDRLLGSASDLLSGGMVTHGDAARFFDLRPAQQRAAVEAAMGVDTDGAFERMARRALVLHDRAIAACDALSAEVRRSAPATGSPDPGAEEERMREATDGLRRVDSQIAGLRGADAGAPDRPFDDDPPLSESEASAVEAAVALPGAVEAGARCQDILGLIERRKEIARLVLPGSPPRERDRQGPARPLGDDEAREEALRLADEEAALAESRASLMECAFLEAHLDRQPGPAHEGLADGPGPRFDIDARGCRRLLGELQSATVCLRGLPAGALAPDAVQKTEEDVARLRGSASALRAEHERLRLRGGEAAAALAELQRARSALESVRADAEADLDANPECESCRRRHSFVRREAARSSLPRAALAVRAAEDAAAGFEPVEDIHAAARGARSRVDAEDGALSRAESRLSDAREAAMLDAERRRAADALGRAAREWRARIADVDSRLSDARNARARAEEHLAANLRRRGLLELAAVDGMISAASTRRDRLSIAAREALRIVAARARAADRSARLRRLLAERDALTAESLDAAGRLALARRDREARLAADDRLAALSSAGDALRRRADKIRRILDMLAGGAGGPGYKEWLYRTRVAPCIEEEIDSFAQDVAGFRVRVEVEGADDIRFRIVDRGSAPSIERASGYQKFIVGLGLRLALCRLSGTEGGVLFIDEGFTACDSSNMRRAREVVDALLARGSFRSAVLTSHLDAVRDIADVSVPVRRDAALSEIRHGDA